MLTFLLSEEIIISIGLNEFATIYDNNILSPLWAAVNFANLQLATL